MGEEKTGRNHVNAPLSDQDLNKLLALLETIDFGSVTLLIQNGKVVQFEKNQKVRLK
jgi:hypothetical protein